MSEGGWAAFADALLRREALACRIGEGRLPRDLAGLYVDDAEVDRILRQLPGLDGPPVARAEGVAAAMTPGLERARAVLHDGLAGAAPFSLAVHSAGLDPGEAEVLALLAAVELDPQRQRLAVYLQDSVHLARVTLALLGRLFPPPHPGVAAVAPDSRLVRSGLVVVESEGPWAVRSAAIAARLAWALTGDASQDPALPPGARRAGGGPTGGEQLLLVPGADRVSRERLARQRLAGPEFLVTSAPADAPGWDAVVREATVAGLGVILHLDGDLSPEGRQRVERADHLAWALASARELALEHLPDRPWVEARAAAADATGTVHGHRLDAEQRALLTRVARGLDGDTDAAVRRLASGHLDGLALRVRPRRGWDDLVLPPEQAEQLRELGARYRHRETVHGRWGFGAVPSAGLVAVLAGPSGTGKTLAAEVIAADVGLDLYKVDLSAVVSKYIGETERNLEGIFSAASAGNVVLFFDEADALFGKRSEVGDAHDRYANIEVSYLLQRLETYDGLVVLATNLQRNMDGAFLRRIHVAVEFALPDESGRRAIWERCFPPACPTADLDLAFLARQFKVSGGAIRNAALTAAFLAAEAGAAVDMEFVVAALRREFAKLGRLRTQGEFDLAPVG